MKALQGQFDLNPKLMVKTEKLQQVMGGGLRAWGGGGMALTRTLDPKGLWGSLEENLEAKGLGTHPPSWLKYWQVP